MGQLRLPQVIEDGSGSTSSREAEVGQVQFLPSNRMWVRSIRSNVHHVIEGGSGPSGPTSLR